MTKKNPAKTKSDRNFDSIAAKFQQNIYNTTKGRLRQLVLQRDLLELPQLQQPGGRVLDVGGGQGQLALWLAGLGHQVLLTDLSGEMLALAQQAAKEQQLSLQIQQWSLQQLAEQQQSAPLVLCHAVLEWLAEPAEAIRQLYQLVEPGGVLSLMFYNVDAKRFSNIVYGNFNYVLRDLAYKKKVSLSPQNPLDPRAVADWCQQAGFIQLSKTGVRCFHDYLRDRSEQETEFDKLLEVELRYNRTEPYASLGRYQHLLLKKPA
ncbi:methyltransferase domain-containing protein [Rheinheimera texasensis]|uniref:methyltransferase domain-containing protein n=1 Tax=Rheinheimera texasensis TaxID=306205 RepID=UPI0004E20D0D|nr:methyltransferase domain-containing protein [Rheinheimera texasensis]